MNDSIPKQLPPYGLRMPPELKERVAAAAKKSNRSINAEIVSTLEEKFPAPLEADFDQIRAAVKDLRVLKELVVEAGPIDNKALEKRLDAFEGYYVHGNISKEDMEKVIEDNPLSFKYKILMDNNG